MGFMQKFPRILSYLLALFGVITVVMAITVTTGSSWLSDLMPEEGADQEDIDFANEAASLGTAFEVLIYIFGVWMLVMGVLGACCCGADVPKGGRIGLFVFQILMFALLVVTIVIALIPAAFWLISDEQMTWFCDNDSASLQAYFDTTEDSGWHIDFIVDGRQFVADADSTIAQRDEIMCSRTCPCDVEDWSAWGADFDTTGLEKDDDGVDDWEDCQELIDAASGSSSTTAVQTYFDGILEMLEEDFECQGVCDTGRFWLFTDVKDGPPTEGCLTSMKSRFANKSLGAAIVMFITVLIDLFIFICFWQYCCCRKTED